MPRPAEPMPVTWAMKRYMSLTTYRRDGRAISTPVWFVVSGNDLLVWTSARSGKGRRLASNPLCTVAPCRRDGTVSGRALEAEGRVLSSTDGPRVQEQLRRKYPLAKRALDAYARLRGLAARPLPAPSTYLAITVRGKPTT